jgi:hypothetical protein
MSARETNVFETLARRPLTGWASLALALASGAAFACGGEAGGATAGATGGTAADCVVGAGGHTTRLECTGLYASSAGGPLASEIATDVIEFAPAEPLWSDGAQKRRFIRLPPGTTIDSRNMDEWVFPAGTQLWKQFSVGGLKVETRYLEKGVDGTWLRTTYAWSDDQSHATEVTTGVQNVRGTGYDIPAQSECSECHQGAIDGVLGFEAIGLSSPGATGLTMQELTRRGLLSSPPAAPLVVPGAPLDVAALSWLHANCGNACHNRTENSAAGWTGLHMRLTTDGLASVQDTDTFKTAVGVASSFQPTPDAGLLRIKPGDPAHSAIPFRDGARAAQGSPIGWQMPPIATNIADTADVDMVKAWIQSL